VPSPTDVLTALRVDLIAAGLIRRPSEAGTLPPAHVEPAEGAPAPGEREGIEDDPELVVTLMHSGDFGEEPQDSYRRRAIIDVRYRSRGGTGLRRAAMLDQAIRARLTGPERNYGRGYLLADGSTYVHQAQQYGGFGPIDRALDGTTPRFTNGAKYLLETLA
jgi:hypothetical protein